MKNSIAIGIIDEQRGFMPAEEGQRLGLSGFGELAVPGGNETVAPLNAVLGSAALRGMQVFMTQDWHPEETAHFSDQPDFVSSWPVHCVAYTPGAALHPELIIPKFTAHFFKGEEALLDGKDDTSYSAYNSRNTAGEMLPAWLERESIHTVALGGLALDYCLGLSALDLRQRLGLEVIVMRDATRPVTPETGAAMVARLEAAGVHIVTSQELLAALEVR